MIFVFYLGVVMFAIFIIRIMLLAIGHIIVKIADFIASITDSKSDNVAAVIITVIIVIVIILIILSEP